MMIAATRHDKHLLIDILSRSFADNGSVDYVIRQGRGRTRRIRALMDYSIEVCLRSGKVLLNSERTACALVLYPHRKRTTFGSIRLNIQLVMCAIGITGIGRVLRRESRINRTRPMQKMAYLWFIGVPPDRQGAGTGSSLLQEMLAEADRMGLPVYLETSTERNLPWYGRFGFDEYATLDLGYVLHFMRRMPQGAGG
ncbi:hypothetical protein GCM10011386_38490 [Parapedobacter defluvii]|uniref:N-acetyltransferase domain-containing protein n=1 Tax=Parapedobacter defluvii TaxID=2045106 RepID=A0ABQ1MLC1_9SPHI|nr:GNAT family N-acetyltransferase [Parapedobacter defluvii]GGC42544.1 hypothetical protein GCM10011386_38490 [Parapedobacter defluvii]